MSKTPSNLNSITTLPVLAFVLVLTLLVTGAYYFVTRDQGDTNMAATTYNTTVPVPSTNETQSLHPRKSDFLLTRRFTNDLLGYSIGYSYFDWSVLGEYMDLSNKDYAVFFTGGLPCELRVYTVEPTTFLATFDQDGSRTEDIAGATREVSIWRSRDNTSQIVESTQITDSLYLVSLASATMPDYQEMCALRLETLRESFTLLPPVDNVAVMSHARMLYATKSGTQVTVWILNTSNASATTLFTYDESLPAEMNSNYWSMRPPSIALAPNGSDLLFVEQDGVAIWDRVTGTTRRLFDITSRPPGDTEMAPQWSLDGLDGVYSLANPGWSPSGKYINLSLGYYEGGYYAIMEPNHPAGFKRLSIGGGTNRLSWSPSTDEYVVANPGGYSEPGVWLSAPADPYLVHPLVHDDARQYLQAAISPDMRHILYISSPQYPNDHERSVSVADVDATTEDTFSVPGSLLTATFVSDDAVVVATMQDDNQLHLITRTLQGQQAELAVLPANAEEYDVLAMTPDGYLMVPCTQLADGTRRFYLVDVHTGAIVYRSPVETAFTTYLGWVE